MLFLLCVYNDVLFVAGLSLDSSLSLGPQSPLDMKPDTASLLAGSFSPGAPNSPKYVKCNLVGSSRWKTWSFMSSLGKLGIVLKLSVCELLSWKIGFLS